MTKASLFRSGGIVTLGILLGRMAGFVRELLIAHFLGGGDTADAAVFTLTLPDVFSNLLIGGAFGAALIPEFQRGGEGATASARKLLLHSTLLSLVAFGLLSALVVLAGPAVVRLLAPGIDPGRIPEASSLVLGSAIVIPLTAAAAVSTAYLQAFHRFALPAAGTLFFNGILIAFLAGKVRPGTLVWLGWAVAIAAAVRWLSQLAVCPAVPKEPGEGEGRVSRALLARYLQALGASALLQLVPVIARSLVSETGPGAFAALNYVIKLTELPLGMVITVLSVVLLPRFSALFAESKEAEALGLARWGVWMTWVLSVPLALAGGWFREPMVALLYGHGRMSADALRLVADWTAWTMAAVPAQGLAGLLFSILSARKDTRRPLLASLVAVVLYFPAAWVGRKVSGPEGVLAAGVALHWAIALAQAWVLTRRHGMALFGDGLGRDLVLATAASCAAFAAVAALGRPEWGTAGRLGLAAAATTASFAAVFLLPRARAAMKAFN